MFEVQVDDCVLQGDTSRLVSLLHSERLSIITLTRLDQLVTKDLCRVGFSRVQVVLKSLEILSENTDDLQTLISHGLTAKVVLWFEAVRNLLTSDLQRSSAPLLSLTEEFFDYFLLLGQASLPVSQLSVILLQLAQFCLETEIHFPLRLEAIRTFNSILESLSRDQRRWIQDQDQIHIQILTQVAAEILTVGDYEMQVSLSEALCRLTPRRHRQLRANQWFSSRDISNAFCDIRDADFEVDCRRFLNFVNHYHGNQRRVHTFPCLRAFLSSVQLFPPKDDKVDEFWIDFNSGSGCVSFFIDEPEGLLWESVHLLKEDVERYSLQVQHDETVLSVWLNNPIMHHNCRGQKVELSFNRQLHGEVEEAAGRVFMMAADSEVEGMCPRTWTHVVQPTTDKHGGRSYGRKKQQSKNQLKILPLSSPSSEEDAPVSTPAATNRAEVLFDQIRHSTPTNRRAPEWAELQTGFGGSDSPLEQDGIRRRDTLDPDTGYLSDLAEDSLTKKRRAEPQQEGEELYSELTGSPPEGAEPAAEEAVFTQQAWPDLKGEGPVSGLEAEPESALTSDVTATLKTLKAELEQHFTGHWQEVETQVLLSLRETEQHVSSLLSAVHQHRLQLLQTFERSVSDQLKRLEENSTNLNTHILRFFQSQRQRLGSFCDELMQRLKSVDSGELGVENPSSQ